MSLTPSSEFSQINSSERKGFTRADIYWWYVLIILTLSSTLNYMDRQIVNILAEPIKHDLHLKDWQVGVLTGFAFAIVYSLAAIPLARLADRSSRPRIIAASLAVWSIFTALSGLTRSFGQFAAARLGVGLGEAGSSPPAHALITDLAPPRRRALALGVFQTGVPLGSLAGMALGGILADRFGWRVALLAAGLPGIILALVAILTVAEPRTRSQRPNQASRTRFTDDAKTIFSKRAYLPITVGGGLIALKAFGTQAFMASFFFRNHAEQLHSLASSLSASLNTHVGVAAVLGPILGVLGGGAGVVGTIWGGTLADRWARRHPTHYATIIAAPQLVCAPILAAGLFWPGLGGAFFLLTLPTLVNSISVAPTWAAVQALATDTTRATAVAIGFLIVTLIGLGLGPLLVGVTSDLLNSAGIRSAAALRGAMLIAVIPSLVGAGIVWRARRHCGAEMEIPV